METPGHTPESSVYVVTDLARGDEPVMVFTGDTLLVGDVGRPDLFPNREEELAEKLYASLKLLKILPDHVEVYPAHGMGSLCGRALSSKRWSTIGTEKRHNYALLHNSVDAFKSDLLANMPAAPDYFSRCSEINRLGPALVHELVVPRPIDDAALKAEVEKGANVLDTRPYLSFAAAHIPGSYSISKNGNFTTFAGWIIPPEENVILVLEHESDLPRLKSMLYSVGIDCITGYLSGTIEDWINGGNPIASIETISVKSLRDKMQESPLLVLDTRAKTEWDEGHIAGTELAPTPDIRHLYSQWDVNTPVVVLCNTSNRSMTAASILKQKGFARVINAVGGTTAWKVAGFSFVTPEEV